MECRRTSCSVEPSYEVNPGRNGVLVCGLHLTWGLTLIGASGMTLKVKIL